METWVNMRILYSQRLDMVELSDIVNKVTHFAHYVLKKLKAYYKISINNKKL